MKTVLWIIGAGIVWCVTLTVVWSLCKAAAMGDMQNESLAQRQREAEGADIYIDPEPEDGFETDGYYGGGWAA